jgi:hypothetical protein
VKTYTILGCLVTLALAGCGTNESQSKAIATANFPKTWDDIDQGASPAVAGQGPVDDQGTAGGGAARVANGPAKAIDVLTLVDGTQLVGVQTQQVPGQYVVIVTAGGEEHTIPWARIGSPGAAAAPAAVPAAPAGEPKRGTVALKDGTKITGILKQVQPGQFVIVDTADGAEHTISWDRVSEVSITPSH